MKIIDIQTMILQIPLKKAFITNIRRSSYLESVIVKIQLDNGLEGYGEAAQNVPLTGETIQSITYIINNNIKQKLIGIDIDDFEQVMTILNNCAAFNYSAKAAIDIALFDLRAQVFGKPLYKLLGGYRNSLKNDITISLNDIQNTLKDCIEAVENGYRILKIKLGSDYNEIEKVKIIRENLPVDIVLRIDCNQSWNAKQAVKIIRLMEDLDLKIEFIEQPVNYKDIDSLAFVKNNVFTPIAADESVFDINDAINIIKKNAADIINLKLIKTGGIYNAFKICDMAEAYGVECMLGCTTESKISITAAASLACAKKNITKVDLDGSSLCKIDPFNGGAIIKNDTILMNENIVLGLEKIDFSQPKIFK